MKYLRFNVLGFLLLALPSLVYGQGDSVEVPKVLVEAMTMEREQIQPKVKLPGVVEPLVQGRLTSEIQGIITRAKNRLGDEVEKGDTVLYVKSTKVGQEFREYAVRARVSGLITSLPITVGEYIEPGSNLGTVTDTNSLRIVGHVPAVHLPNIKNGQRAKFKIGKLTVNTKITGISRKIQGNTGTARVEFIPQEKVNKLVTGTVGQLTVFMDQMNTLAVPLSAKVEIGEKTYVRKIIDDKIQMQEVDLGRMIGQKRLVNNGLEVGDEIVVRATDHLKSGDPIKRADSPSEQDSNFE